VKQAERSGWPSFGAPLLQEVARAFLRRRKALRYQAGLTCGREFSETPQGSMERLNLDLRQGPADLRLSLWADGVLFLRLCVKGPGRNSGWAFLDSFHGDVQDVSAAALVGLVEATLAEPFEVGRSDQREYRERWRQTWARVRRGEA
jgi:hypothetical protein